MFIISIFVFFQSRDEEADTILFLRDELPFAISSTPLHPRRRRVGGFFTNLGLSPQRSYLRQFNKVVLRGFYFLPLEIRIGSYEVEPQFFILILPMFCRFQFSLYHPVAPCFDSSRLSKLCSVIALLIH